MPIDSIQRVPHYQIDSSSEATEEERRREERRKKNSAEKSSNVPSDKDGAAAKTSSIKESSAFPTELTSQIADGEKVVELLSHRPKESTVKYQTFKRLDRATKPVDDASAKKLNKAF